MEEPSEGLSQNLHKTLTSRSCILQRGTLPGKKPQPQSVFAQESNACLFLT